ncbi:hypothetical protein [Amycolatopsis sp. NPDC051903]|uniref:hypothetical protein n=1 Tax=Amycolatopsis sp. NPDC051903 TaxID=3363936 RepID=UPI00379BBF44
MITSVEGELNRTAGTPATPWMGLPPPAAPRPPLQLPAHTAAELKQRRHTLRHVMLSPSRTGYLVRTGLVLNGVRT